MTKYQAGDEVTIRLDEEDAPLLNNGGIAGFGVLQIISHTPKKDLLDVVNGYIEAEMTKDALRTIAQYLREKEAERG